jgi:hypothetical protein
MAAALGTRKKPTILSHHQRGVSEISDCSPLHTLHISGIYIGSEENDRIT